MGEKERFLELFSTITRPGKEALLKWLESSDFFTAPASAKYHGAYEGGLLEHSLNVYDELVRLKGAYTEFGFSDESIIICSLLHDICKVNFYKPEIKNRKNAEGKWESYQGYGYEEKYTFGFHGPKSVFILQKYIDLSPEEAAAIANHMGAFENEKCGDVYERYPLATLLHWADEAATYLKEGKGEKGNK